MSHHQEKQYKLTLIRSACKRIASHKACLQGLGLRKLHQSVVIMGTPSNMGMVDKIRYMLVVEEV